MSQSETAMTSLCRTSALDGLLLLVGVTFPLSFPNTMAAKLTKYVCDKCGASIWGKNDFRMHKKTEHPYNSEARSLKVAEGWQSMTDGAKLSRRSGLKKGVVPGDNTSGPKPFVAHASTEWKRTRNPPHFGQAGDVEVEFGGDVEDDPMPWHCHLLRDSNTFQCSGCEGSCTFFPFRDIMFLEAFKDAGLPSDSVAGYVAHLIKKAMLGAESDPGFEDMLMRSLMSYFNPLDFQYAHSDVVSNSSVSPCRGRLCVEM